MLKAKIVLAPPMWMRSNFKNKIPGSLVLKKDIILFLFVFVGKWLHLNVFRNNDFEYL